MAKRPTFPLEIFYDGACIACSTEIESYRKRESEGRLIFIDISATDFIAEDYGRSREEFMAQMHVRDGEGRYHLGVDAFLILWKAFPAFSKYGLLGSLISLPGVKSLAKGGYRIFARYRHLLPKNKVFLRYRRLRPDPPAKMKGHETT